MIRLNKNQLDFGATVFGALAGVCTVLVTQGIGDRQIVGTVGGVATVFLGVITQRPTSSKPTTEDVEDA